MDNLIQKSLSNIAKTVSERFGQANNALGNFYKGFAVTPQKVQNTWNQVSNPVNIIRNTASVLPGGSILGNQAIRPTVDKYIQNRYVEPVKNIIPSAQKLVAPKSTLLQRGEGVLGILGGAATLVPDPIQDVGMPIYDLLKGAKAYQVQNQGKKLGLFEAIQKGGLPALTMEKPVGLGEALTKNTTGQTIGNLAELPLVMGLAHSMSAKSKAKLLDEDVKEIGKIANRFSKGWMNNGMADINQMAKDENLVDTILNSKYKAPLEELKKLPLDKKINTLFGIAMEDFRGGPNFKKIQPGLSTKPIEGVKQIIEQPSTTKGGVPTIDNTDLYGKVRNFAQRNINKSPQEIKANLIKEFGEDPTITLFRGTGSGRGVNPLESDTSLSVGKFWSPNANHSALFLGPKGKMYSVDIKASDLLTKNIKGLARNEIHLNNELQQNAKLVFDKSKSSTPQIELPKMETPVVTGKARLKVRMKPVEGTPEMQAPKMNLEPPGRPYPWSVWNEKLNKWIDPSVPEEVIYGKTEMPSIDKVNVAEANTLLGNNGQGGLKGLDNTTKTAFQDWVNARRATSLEGLLKKREFSDLDATGPEAFKVFQEGFTKGKYGEVKKYFDSKHQQILETGMPVNYKQNYLPQLWENDKAQVQSIFGNKLGTKPSFTMESVIKDYQEGIDKGLTPKFKTIGELVGWYEKTANKAIADHSFFKYLGKEGMIMSQSKAPSNWVTLSPDRFPKVKVNVDGQQYSGTYKAPPEMAKLINNYLNTADEGLLAKIAGFTSRAKNIALSFGVPGTGINAHGVNILARHTLFGTGGNPISRFLTGAKYMVNPGAAEAFLNRELSTGPRAVRAGMTLSAEDHNGILNEAETLAKSLGKKWNQAFEVPLFNKMIPALKLSSFNQLVNNGMSEKEAAIMANNVYSGINWEQMGRDRNTQNLLRAILLAPDWAESGVRLGGNIGKSLFTNGKVAARYRTMAATLLGSIVTANVTNKLTSGHYMYENEPGHTFEIEIGYTSDGQKRYLRPYGTAVDFVRLPVDIVIGLSKGDPTPFFRSFSNRMAMPLASALHLITNTDYTGNAIYGRTKYGKEIPPLQAAGGIGSEVMSAVGFPSFAKQAIDTVTGKQGLEQGLTKGFELPLRYSGGTFSGNDKKIADTLKVSGKEKYDLSKQLRDQANFSENQMALIQQKGREGLNAIIQKRALDNQKEELRKQAEQGNTAQSGNLVVVVTKDGTRVIDTSFQPTKPSLTGQKELDKALTSKYNSEINQKKNDLMLLYKDGKIPLSQIEPQLVELEGMKIKAPTKLKAAPKVKKVAVRKVRTSTAKFKVKAPKLTKIKITKPKKFKLSKTPKLTKIKPLAK